MIMFGIIMIVLIVCLIEFIQNMVDASYAGNIEKKHKEQPELRIAQQALAHEMIRDLHGEEEYQKALEMSKALFSGDVSKLTAKEIKEVFKDAPIEEIKEDTNIVDLLVNYNVCSSKREAREFVTGGTISINGERVTDLEKVVTKKDTIDNEYVILRRGKKKYYLFEYK